MTLSCMRVLSPMKDVLLELDRIYSAIDIEEEALYRYRLDLKDVVLVLTFLWIQGWMALR